MLVGVRANGVCVYACAVVCVCVSARAPVRVCDTSDVCVLGVCVKPPLRLSDGAAAVCFGIGALSNFSFGHSWGSRVANTCACVGVFAAA